MLYIHFWAIFWAKIFYLASNCLHLCYLQLLVWFHFLWIYQLFVCLFFCMMCLPVTFNFWKLCACLSFHLKNHVHVFFLQCLIGWGINGKGFNSKLAMVKMCSTWLSKNLKWVFSLHRYLRPPIGPMPMRKAKIWKSEFRFCHVQNVFTIT